jgi:alginate O-acetyltransferase complex protein AlgI
VFLWSTNSLSHSSLTPVFAQLKTFKTFDWSLSRLGLWNGAHWNFLIWGLLHGIWLAAEHNVRLLPSWIARFPRTLNLIKIVLVFHGVTLLWVFSRSTTFETATQMLATMLLPPYSIDATIPDALISIIVGFLIFGSFLAKHLIDDKYLKVSLIKQISLVLFLMLLILAYSQAKLDFIYFVF